MGQAGDQDHTVEDKVDEAKAQRRVALPVVATETYEIDTEVARGGLGRVMKAHDARLGRTVAIKELLPGQRKSEARFVREALITARLEHPAIVPVHEAGRWPSGEPFYAMKLISGRPLSEVIKQTPDRAARMALLPNVIAVAEAIAYAHSKKVIHRDIKPANVIIGEFGETVVIDWGIAKDLSAPHGEEIIEENPSERTITNVDATRLGDVMGTPAYMAPEQARGELIDERVDVYALGALLYYLLSGSSPYAPTTAGDTQRIEPSSTTTQMLADVALRAAVPLEERVPDVPYDLLTIVRKAMARTADERYASAAELAEDLRRFQTGQLVRAREYSVWALARHWVVQHRAIVLVAAAALALLIVVGAVSVARIVHARGVAEEQRTIADDARQLAEARSV
jgi:serine/threonine protein kinase